MPKNKAAGLRVQTQMCATCVYQPKSPLDPEMLEDRVRSKRGDFEGYRVCHSSHTACCAGFWARHKDDFALGQIAQRIGLVVLVQDNTPTRISRAVAAAWKQRNKRGHESVQSQSGGETGGHGGTGAGD